MKRLADADLKSAPARARFLLEAQLASQLHHPGFLPIYDAGLDPQGRPFYTTALLSGRTFQHVIHSVHNPENDHRLELLRALDLLRQLCKAAAYAHSCGVVHRDLKPPNILIGDFGEVFIIDLGSACALGSPPPEFPPHLKSCDAQAARSEWPHRGGVSAFIVNDTEAPTTLVFTPPEALSSSSVPPAPQTDIYALGVILYELCSGRLPYSLDNARLPPDEQLVELIRKGPPVPIRHLKRNVPTDLAAICGKAMAREPSRRYETAAALANDLQAFLETRVVSARRSRPLSKLKKWTQRNGRYVAIGSAALAIVVVALSTAHSLKVRSDAALQLNHLRDAQIAARNGQWRKVPDHLRAAELAGYTNFVDLALQRIEAYTVLSEHALVSAELEKLQRHRDLGPYRAVVLLRRAEHELLERSTAEAGIAHLRQALAAGLGPADERVAKGLLAETSPEALAWFQQALNRNPFDHAAHLNRLSLELLLGQNEDLDRHCALMRVLYPEDPAPLLAGAFRLAAFGRLDEAEKIVEPVQKVLPPRTWQLLRFGLEVLRQEPKLFDLDSLLRQDKTELLKIGPFLTNAFAYFVQNRQPAVVTNQINIRVPQLPCIKNGLGRAMHALIRLMPPLSLFSDKREAMEEIKAACRAHPEAGIALAAAGFLDFGRRPNDARERRALLQQQSELYQMAIAMPSMLPNAHRCARFLAALVQVDLGHRFQPPDPHALQNCLTNLRWFLEAENTTAVQFHACFNMAFELREFDLAREFLTRWERVNTDLDEINRNRIALEVEAEAYPVALRLLDRLLEKKPTHPWGVMMRKRVIFEIREAAASLDRLTQGRKAELDK